MTFLMDTHLLLWAADDDRRLSTDVRRLLQEDERHAFYFSAASIWEIGIKSARGRADFTFNARLVRRGLLDNGYLELEISAAHGIEAASLPPIHADPFDRMLVAQARLEGLSLLTADPRVAEYGEPVVLV